MFNAQNTTGFTQDQLDLMNEALNVLIAAGWDEEDASDKVNNNWVDGATIDDLVK